MPRQGGRIRSGAVVAGVAVAAAMGLFACGDDDDDDVAEPPGPPPLATRTIGAYEFDNQEVARDADAARRATGRYLDEKNARNDGYVPQPRGREVCSDPPGPGHGGVEYVNEALVSDGELDIARPEALLYQPGENGTRRLTALQYRPPEGQRGMLFGRQITEPLTVWVYLFNPDGLLEPGNRNASCPPGPVRDTEPPAPSGGPPGGGGGGPPGGGDAGGGPPGDGGGGPPGGDGEGGPPAGADGGGPPEQ